MTLLWELLPWCFKDQRVYTIQIHAFIIMLLTHKHTALCRVFDMNAPETAFFFPFFSRNHLTTPLGNPIWRSVDRCCAVQVMMQMFAVADREPLRLFLVQILLGGRSIGSQEATLAALCSPSVIVTCGNRPHEETLQLLQQTLQEWLWVYAQIALNILCHI